MAIVFETQQEFEDAVMAVLKDRLVASVYVNKRQSSDFYSRDIETNVEIDILDSDEDGYGLLTRAEGQG